MTKVAYFKIPNLNCKVSDIKNLRSFTDVHGLRSERRSNTDPESVRRSCTGDVNALVFPPDEPILLFFHEVVVHYEVVVCLSQFDCLPFLVWLRKSTKRGDECWQDGSSDCGTYGREQGFLHQFYVNEENIAMKSGNCLASYKYLTLLYCHTPITRPVK